MGKTTNRVLSLVLTVLMVLSMVSVFAIPAAAADTGSDTALDYDALFNGKDTFLINIEWDLTGLDKGDELEIWFSGKNRTVKYDPTRHFSSYEEAYETIWDALDASNYFTYKPTIIFGPGEYDEAIPIHGTATILGANAGISPNAAISEDDWNIDYVMNNQGWVANPNRDSDYETVITQSIYFSTRTQGSDGAWTNQVYTGEDAKYTYYKEKAFTTSPDASLNHVIDGVTITASAAIDFSGADVSATGVTYNNETLPVVGGREINLVANNVIYTGSSYLVGAWNTNNDYYSATFNNLRSTGKASNFVQRYVDHFTAVDSYITGWSGSMTNASLPNAKHNDTTFTIKDSILANGPQGNTAVFNGESKKNGFVLTLDNNLMYNISGANYGAFRIDLKTGIDVTLNITNNEIYHDISVNTFFNGNPEYVTAGRYFINFNGNKVISPSLAAIPPNSQYDAASAGSILYYNFDGNFFATDKSAEGKPTTFAAGPSAGAVLASGWDYKDTNYFYDYNMNYSSHGMKIVDADMGENNIVEIGNNTIFARCYNTKGVITPEFFVDDEKAGAVKAKVELATDLAFENVVETIDIDALGDAATYYVRAYYEGTAYERVYKLDIIAADPVDFNDGFMADGLDYAGYDLTYDNTAVYVTDIETEADGDYAYGFLGDTYYRFKVDNDLVFSSMSKLAQQMKMVKDPVVLLPSADYGNMTVSFAATYLGTNAAIDPVDDTVSVLADGSDWALGNGWGERGDTSFDVITVADGLEGKLKMVGITLRGQFLDTERTFGKGGKVYGNLDITLENIVVDQNKNLSFSDKRTAEIKSEFTTGPSSAYLITLTNRRSANFDQIQSEADGSGGTMDIEYSGFGDTYNDSFTIKSMWIKDTSDTTRFMNEIVPAHVTLDNVYRDAQASGAANILGWYKTGILNKNASFTMVNCNFRNAVTSNNHPLVGLEGASGAATGYAIDSKIAADATYDVVVENNVFVDASRDTGSTKQAYVLLSPAYMSSVKINNNFAMNTDAPSIYFTDHVAKHDPGLADEDVKIRGNIEISGNNLIGFAAENIMTDFALGEDNPELADTFYTTDVANYLTDSVGTYDKAMGQQSYWFDFARTDNSKDYVIGELSAATDKVSAIWSDLSTNSFGATIYEGKLSDLIIEIPEGAVGVWSADQAGTDTFEDKTVEEMGYAAVYYYTLSRNGRSTTYRVVIYTADQIEFSSTYEDNGYFDNTAVILTEKAADVAVGTSIVVEWEGVDYTFYAGVNAFNTPAKAAASRSGPTEAVSVLVPKEFGDSYYGGGAVDLALYGPVKMFAPNYNINPVLNDGLGLDSPTQGAGWGYNEEYDANQILVREIAIDWGSKGTVEAYGFTCTRRFIDTGRSIGNEADIKIENIFFNGQNIHAATGSGSQYMFHFDRYSAKNPEGSSSVTVKNAYFDVPATIQSGDTTVTRAARLLGELTPAHFTFDGIYIDFEGSAIQDHSAYIKNIANHSSFTLKNSCLINSENTNSLFNFEGYIDNPESGNTSGGVWKAGRSNSITYENNIFSNFTTKSSSYLLQLTAPYAYTDVTVKDNYMSGRLDDSIMLFYASGLNKTVRGFKANYTITGNVINGMGNSLYQIGESSKYYPSGWNWVIKDNFVTYSKVADAYADGVKAYVPGYETRNMEDGVNLEYSHRIDAKGLIPTNVIYDMEFVNGAVVEGDTITVNTVEGAGIISNGKVTLANIIKTNDYVNILRTKVDGSYVDARTAVDNGDNLVLQVRSADNKSEIKDYNVKINIINTAPAFVTEYVDPNPIVNEETGASEPILNTALMVSAELAGKTGDVIVEWDGNLYTFTMGQNAFATVADALAYAKETSMANTQILFKNVGNKTVSFGITYPCKIYTENYNTMPYITDGYGPDSPSYGESWFVNNDYKLNRTDVEVIWIDTAFTGKVELNGFTLRNSFLDIYRQSGTLADITLRNTMLNTDNVSNTMSNYVAITGIADPSNDMSWNSYIFRLGSNSNYTDKGNRFVIKNMFVQDIKNYGFIGEFMPHYTEINGLYVNDGVQSQFLRGENYIKQSVDGTEVVYKNCNLQRVQPATAGDAIWSFEGSRASTDVKTLKLTVDNNIFNSFEQRTFGSGDPCLFNMYMQYYSNVTVTNNYIASPYNKLGKTNISLFGTHVYGDVTVDAIETDFVIRGNVFNATNGVDVGIDGTQHSKNGSFIIEGNYMVPSGYVEDVANVNPIGRKISTKNNNVLVNTYCLDYDRTILSTDVVAPEFAALDNIVVENDGTVSYIADDKLAVANGALVGNVDHIIASVSPYSTVKLVLGDTEAELDADIDLAGVSSVAIRVYSYDGTAHEDIIVNVVDSTAHKFTEYTFNNDATCQNDGTETAFCNGNCGDAECLAQHTRVAVGTKADHTLDRANGVLNNDATCQTNRTITYTCTVEGCGAKVSEEVPFSTVDHSYDNYVAHEPATCAKAGTEKGECIWCDATNVRENVSKYPFDESRHTWGEWVYTNDATCVKDGTDIRDCVDCEASETRTSPTHTAATAAHKWGEYTYNGDATCAVDGTMSARCTVDGCRAKNTIPDPAFKANDTLHVWGDYKYDNNATCCDDGTQSATCTVCGDKHTVVAPNTARGHDGAAAAMKDVKEGKWYENAVEYVVSHGYISGITESEFGINVNITRGMFVTILARVAGVDTSNAANRAATTKFTDVKVGRYYTAAIAWANKNGIVAGKSATTFEPETAISRQELAVMIVNFAEAQGITLTEKNKAITFADASSIAGWAKKEVAACQKAGIISGYNEGGKTFFKPTNTATRAEAAQMIYKFVTELA